MIKELLKNVLKRFFVQAPKSTVMTIREPNGDFYIVVKEGDRVVKKTKAIYFTQDEVARIRNARREEEVKVAVGMN